MSILSFPRVNFRGVFRTNPCTANNDDVMPAVVERDIDSLGATVAGMTDDQIHAYLREQVSMSYPGSNSCVAFMRSGWNLYGDHFTAFDDTVVTSVVTGPTAAEQSTTAAQDPLVGAAVNVLGSVTGDPARRGDPILCDLDSTGLVTTQLWIGGLQLGSGGPMGTDASKIITQIDYDTRAYQNWLNFFSTVGSYGGEQNFVGIGCMMQFAIPASALPATVNSTSPGLQALFAAARAAAGLVVRFRCYEVEPQITDENLFATFQQGNAIDNPALGYLVGTIGVWQQGEPETEPAGRKLQATYTPNGRPTMAWQSPDGTVNGSIPGIPQPWEGPPALIGNAVALVQPSAGVISLDLIQTFPKYGYRNPDGPQTPTARGFAAPKAMANVGSVELAVVSVTGGPPQVIAPINYGLGNYSLYEDLGGIVDVPYDSSLAPLIASGTLIIQGSAASTLNANVMLVQETIIRVVTDDRALYLAPGATNQVVRLKVFERGGPTTSDTVIYPVEYANIIQVEPPSSSCGDGVRPNQTVSSESPGILNFPSPVTIPAGQGYSDWFEIEISAPQSGATVLSYQIDTTVFGDSVPAWTTCNYSSIRVYAADDFSALYAKGPLQWADVYANVLRYYALIYPAMSTYIPLNLADSIVQQGALIKQRLNIPGSPGFFTTLNMPLTRTMSPAKVQLVLDFIDQQNAGKGQRSLLT
jgi:hypothetical protein